MATPKSFESKIGMKDVFTEERNLENNQETISINKVGSGSFFSKIIPELSFKKKLVIGAALATALVGSIVGLNSNTDNNPNVNATNEATAPAPSMTMAEKIAQSVGKMGSVIQSSEKSTNDKSDEIHKNNEKVGAKGTSTYKSEKMLGELKGIRAINTNENDVFSASKFVNDKNKDHLNQIGRFEIDPKLANNVKANLIARHSFRNGNLYEALMVTGEGFTKTTADNIGSTIYHGINTKFQQKETLKQLAMGVSQNQAVIDAHKSLGGVGSAQETRKIMGDNWLSNPRALQMAVLLQETYDASIVKVVGSKTFNNIDPNIQAAVRYTGFKVGGGGFAKYKTFNTKLQQYANTPETQRTQQMRDDLAESISFKYTITVEKDGKVEKMVKEDTRATMLVRSMIRSPQAFGYMINEDVKPNYFDEMYKSVTGDVKTKFDKNEFDINSEKYANTMSSPAEVIKRYEDEGYKVGFDPKKDYYIDTPEFVLKKEAERFNLKSSYTPAAPTIVRHCIGTTTISCKR